MNKHRQEVLVKRQALSEQQREHFAQAVFQHWLNAYTNLPPQRHVGCYLAVKGEVETLAIIQQIIAHQHQCYLPRLAAPHTMTFARYTPGDSLIQNKYHILEPLPQAQTIGPHDLDMVLVPLVSFDKAGNRMGMGAGYYDSAFAFLQQKSQRSKPQLIGLAYSWQEIECIKANPWDIPLDAVITEIGIRCF